MGDLLGLKYKERTALEAVIATSRDAKQLQRARALLWRGPAEAFKKTSRARASVSKPAPKLALEPGTRT